jgi:hypothetical protein
VVISVNSQAAPQQDVLEAVWHGDFTEKLEHYPDAGPWPGYAPKRETLAVVTPRQRRILTPGSPVWQEPVLA